MDIYFSNIFFGGRVFGAKGGFQFIRSGKVIYNICTSQTEVQVPIFVTPFSHYMIAQYIY